MRKDNKNLVEMTVKEFMEDYDGFDWSNGKIVLVVRAKPFICCDGWKTILKNHENDILRNYTHDTNLMVMIV